MLFLTEIGSPMRGEYKLVIRIKNEILNAMQLGFKYIRLILMSLSDIIGVSISV